MNIGEAMIDWIIDQIIYKHQHKMHAYEEYKDHPLIEKFKGQKCQSCQT